MRAFYLAFRDAAQIIPQPVGQIAAELPFPVAELPWGSGMHGRLATDEAFASFQTFLPNIHPGPQAFLGL
jgi:hypothetical protein